MFHALSNWAPALAMARLTAAGVVASARAGAARLAFHLYNTEDDVARAVFLGGETLARSLGIPRPRIGVLGLNPHAGEDGLFGDEEGKYIMPAIE